MSVSSQMQIAAAPPTCPADNGNDCGSDSGEWTGEFFPGIPKIKYEVIILVYTALVAEILSIELVGELGYVI